MAFFQDPPELGNQFRDDATLRSYLARALPDEVRRSVEPELDAMGELAGGELHRLQREDRPNEPRLVQWDAWGRRVDRIELTAVWQRAAKLAAEHGVVASAYDRRHGASARIHQFALAYLFAPSTDTYTCPLAMTDGAARTLLAHDNRALVDRAVPHLTSRDPARAWTSGQWMTERTGGSDVGLSETVARPCDSAPGAHRLYGTKWFTSAATSNMALTLARPEGQPSGSRGLTLFYLETRDGDGIPNGISLNRLKDKLGTRKLPTAELTLDGTVALPVAGIGHGVRYIAPMLNVTRTWNAVCAVAGMRRGLALARDYARRRVQFGAPLSQKPLHLDTLATLAAELEGAFALSFRVVELLGREEAGEASDDERALLRLLTPVAKLTTGKQCVAAASEILECFGGAGYVEDTGLPRLLCDAQVLPIWEGTTNVLSLDLLRGTAGDLSLRPIAAEIERLVSEVRDADLVEAAGDAARAFERARAWLQATAQRDPSEVEAGARRFALTVGRALELALCARHAQWARGQGDARPAHAAMRLRATGIDLVRDGLTREQAEALFH